jgi:hypothetical protein
MHLTGERVWAGPDWFAATCVSSCLVQRVPETGQALTRAAVLVAVPPSAVRTGRRSPSSSSRMASSQALLLLLVVGASWTSGPRRVTMRWTSGEWVMPVGDGSLQSATLCCISNAPAHSGASKACQLPFGCS